jgi:predicted alpha/beta superfamily hydrolase
LRKLCSILSLIVLSNLSALACAEEAPQSYALPNTEVRDLHAAQLNRDYQLYVSLPDSYRNSGKTYPVVFVTDAPYAFPVTRAIEARITGHSKDLREFILVGLSYAKGDTAEYSRRRDYTPSPNGVKDATSDMPGRKPVFGEAEAYRRFVADEVFPYIASHYRADMQHKIFAGHSYGSLFGTYVLLTTPEMFDGYVLGSPSLWYDDHLLFTREREYAAKHKDLSARIYIGAGAFEGPAPKSNPHDPRYASDGDMVADAKAFSNLLASRHYRNLHVKSEIIADENHLTVAPILMTRGLLWTLGSASTESNH